MITSQDRVVLLFFKDYERDSLLPNDRYVKRILRPLYRRLTKKPQVSGFLVWCNLLIRALESEGFDVHLNNYSLARRNPHYPVGLIGYPHLLDGWALPNPAILGPSLFDHPQQKPGLFHDSRYKRYIVTCDWMHDLFAPVYGERCVQWYAAMDTAMWPDTRSFAKTTDVLIYDKIRWNRERYEPELRQPILDHLTSKGLTYKILRYGHYDYSEYRRLLCQSKSMIFLCEHETQGMAYQEALASNVPVMAWDQGWWLDPNRARFSSEPVPATSVPYFDATCGEKFTDAGDFPQKFDGFWNRLATYEPRRFVEQELSMARSAGLYWQHYCASGLEAQGAAQVAAA